VVAHPDRNRFERFEDLPAFAVPDLLIQCGQFGPRRPMLPLMPAVPRICRIPHQTLFVGKMAVDFGDQAAAQEVRPSRSVSGHERIPQFTRQPEHRLVLGIDRRDVNGLRRVPSQASHISILGALSLDR
jgi:hypothetical protein